MFRLNQNYCYSSFRTEEQRQLLDDETVDPEKEKERCANYNFGYDGRTERRRLFLGTLLADDSMDILKAVGLEMYNIFHTVSFIESNVTHNLSPREMRFYDSDKPSQNLYQLYQYFGPKTRVSVDYYSNHMQGGYDLLRDFIQREGNNFRWAFNGMKPDDVAVVGDTDETFTRDFLRGEFNSLRNS
jgi:cellulose synthase/poly-beta-1,6-N-acetylglucosamine synthase-like glycosyltransferase